MATSTLPSATMTAAPSATTRAMMGLNALNHLPYLLLYVYRSIAFPDPGEGERPFYFESMIFSAALGPFRSIYSEEAMQELLVAIKEACLIVPPTWFYIYQIVEGTFHFLIFFGYLAMLFRYDWGVGMYKVGMISEIFLMDWPYMVAFQIVAFQVGSPLAHVCAISHHLTVLPNLLWWWSWRSDIKAKKAKAKAK